MKLCSVSILSFLPHNVRRIFRNVLKSWLFIGTTQTIAVGVEEITFVV
jgi:hypothetical protein